MTNESAILGLLADLYRDRAQAFAANAELQAENQALREELARAKASDDDD